MCNSLEHSLVLPQNPRDCPDTSCTAYTHSKRQCPAPQSCLLDHVTSSNYACNPAHHNVMMVGKHAQTARHACLLTAALHCHRALWTLRTGPSCSLEAWETLEVSPILQQTGYQSEPGRSWDVLHRCQASRLVHNYMQPISHFMPRQQHADGVTFCMRLAEPTIQCLAMAQAGGSIAAPSYLCKCCETVNQIELLGPHVLQ